jgi:hypothetical protein
VQQQELGGPARGASSLSRPLIAIASLPSRAVAIDALSDASQMRLYTSQAPASATPRITAAPMPFCRSLARSVLNIGICRTLLAPMVPLAHAVAHPTGAACPRESAC